MMMERLKKIMPYVVGVVLGLIVCIFIFHRHSSPAPSPVGNSHSGRPQITSSLSVVPKSSPEDSDLVIEHHYKATIDGEVVNVPIRTSNPPINSEDKIEYKQELDITPLLSDYEHKKNWEVGAGVGCHDGDVYFPVSIQRNLSHDRAIEGVVHISDSGSVTGGEVLYKHRF